MSARRRSLETLIAIDGMPPEIGQLCATDGQRLGAATAWDWTLAALKECLTADRDAAVLQGFADCEALIIAMARSQAQQLEDGTLPVPGNAEGAGLIASWALNSFALALNMGQHRTDAYDPDELRQAHARAAVKPGIQSAGGKARAASLTPKQRSKQASKAIKARWAKERAK